MSGNMFHSGMTLEMLGSSNNIHGGMMNMRGLDLGFWPELFVHHLVKRPWADRGESAFGKAGF